MSPALLMFWLLVGHRGMQYQNRGLVQPLYQEARESAARMWPAPARVALEGAIADSEAQEVDQLPAALAGWKTAFAQALALQPSPATDELKGWIELSAINYIAFREHERAVEFADQADTNLDAIWADVLESSEGRFPPGQIFAIVQQVRLKTGSFPCYTAAEAARLLRAHPPTDTQQFYQLSQQVAAADCVPAHADWPALPPPGPLAVQLDSLELQVDPDLVDRPPITKAELDAARQQLDNIKDRLRHDPSLWQDNLQGIAWMPYAMEQTGEGDDAHRWAHVVLDHIFENLNLQCADDSAQPDKLQTLWRAMGWRFLPPHQGLSGPFDPLRMISNIAWGDFGDTLARIRASDCILKPLMLLNLAVVADGPDN